MVFIVRGMRLERRPAMNHVRINAKVVTDDTGIQTEIPVILIEHDGRIFELEPLVDYFLANIQAKSLSWAQKLCQGSRCCSTTWPQTMQYFSKPSRLCLPPSLGVCLPEPLAKMAETQADFTGCRNVLRTPGKLLMSLRRILGLDEPEVRDKTAQPLARSHDP